MLLNIKKNKMMIKMLIYNQKYKINNFLFKKKLKSLI